MKHIWHYYLLGGVFNFLLIFPQPLFGNPDIRKCESGFKGNISQEDLERILLPVENYLVRHLPDIDKILTEEREKELVYIYQHENDPIKREEALTEILSAQIKLIRKMARTISGSWKRNDYFVDLVQDSIVFVVDRLKEHDPEKSRLASYILNYVPRFMGGKMREYVSPVFVSRKYRKTIEQTEDIAAPSSVELKPSNMEDNEPIYDYIPENQVEVNENLHQIKRFILQIGGTAEQRYILRHRIFTFHPQSLEFIGKKLGTHQTSVGEMEKTILQKISEHFGNGQIIESVQVLVQIENEIDEGTLTDFVDDSETDWQLDYLTKQIKYFLQKAQNAKHKQILKQNQIETLATQLELDELGKYILTHRLLEDADNLHTFADIGKKFGVTQQAVFYREKKLLKALNKAEFASPELKELVEMINLRKERPHFITEDAIDQKAEKIVQEAKLDEIEDHILRYRLLREKDDRQTVRTISKIFNVTHHIILSREQRTLRKLKETRFRSSELQKIVKKIQWEAEQRKKKRTPTVDQTDQTERDLKLLNLSKQFEDFILEVGESPRQIYILRYRILTFHPHSYQFIAKKFKTYVTDITSEENQLLKKLTEILSDNKSAPIMEKDRIFTKIINRILKGIPFTFMDKSEAHWRLDILAKQAGLDKMEAHILKYQILEESGERQTSLSIGKIFGESRVAVERRKKIILEKLKRITFTSPELKELIKRIQSKIEQRKRVIPIVLDKERLVREWEILSKQWNQNKLRLQQHILEYRLLREPADRKTMSEVANMVQVQQSTIQRQEKAILKILKEKGLVTFQ